MDSVKISKIEGIALILIIAINQVILGIPKNILASNSSGALINVIIISIIAFIAVLLINKLFKPFQNSDILDVSEFSSWKPLKIIIGILYIIFFFLSCVTCLYCMIETLINIYFQNTSVAFLALFFIICIIFAIRKGFSATSRVNLIIVFLSLREHVNSIYKIRLPFCP